MSSGQTLLVKGRPYTYRKVGAALGVYEVQDASGRTVRTVASPAGAGRIIAPLGGWFGADIREISGVLRVR